MRIRLIHWIGICIVTLMGMGLLVGCEETSNRTAAYRPEAVLLPTKTYRVGIHPYLNSKKMYTSYRPILNYLESKLPGVQFEIETSQDYPAYEAKLYAQRFDFSLPNPYQTVNSLQHGYHVIAKMKPDDVFRGIFVARKDANLQHVTQLKGKTLSFPAPTALAATMMPLAFLQAQGVDVQHDIRKQFVGSQFSSIMNAFTGDTIVGVTWPPPWEQWKKENPQMAAQMHVVWETEPLVNNGFVVKKELSSELATQVAQLLTTMDKDPHGKKLLDAAGFEGFETANDAIYEKVQRFLQQYDATIGLPQ